MPRRTSSELILDAAGQLFGRQGYHATRVAEIARKAGVAQGTVYLYFDSKEQLYLDLLERFASAVRAASERIDWNDIRSAVDLRDRFTDLVVDLFELCAADREVAGLLFNGPPVGGRSMEIRSALISAAEGITASYLEIGTSVGLFRPVAVAPIARAIVGLLLHTVTRTIVEEGRTHGLRPLAEQLLDFEMHGLLAPQVDAVGLSPAAGPVGS